MKTSALLLPVVAGCAMLAASCKTTSVSMREANTLVEFEKGDFALSEQVSGEGTSSKVLGVDFYHLFHPAFSGAVSQQKEGFKLKASSIPIVGGTVDAFLGDRTASYALYDLMSKNPGYDAVFYPQFSSYVRRPFLGIGFFYKETEVRAKARLGKLK